jgi:hypothetical protein
MPKIVEKNRGAVKMFSGTGVSPVRKQRASGVLPEDPI